MKQERKSGIGDIISTLIIAVLFAVILLLVVFSASSYRNATSGQSENDNSRAVLSYITTAVRGSAAGPFTPREFEGNSGLSIADGETGYEQRFYLHDGKIMQEYGKTGAATDPDHALVIGEAGELAVDFVGDGVLEIRTDLGTSYVSTMR